MTSEESRTYYLERSLVNNLASPDLDLRYEAASQLPDALSRSEINDVALQVSLVPGDEGPSRAERLERDTIFHLGIAALKDRSDLVTAQSASKELLSRWDISGFAILSLKLIMARRHVSY